MNLKQTPINLMYKLQSRRLIKYVLIILVFVYSALFIPQMYIQASCAIKGTYVQAHSIRPNDKINNSLATIREFTIDGEAIFSQYNTRQASRTFISYPEWYIVFHADELAQYTDKNIFPHGFDYSTASKQYWDAYADMYCYSNKDYYIDKGEEIALMIIGPSFTLENQIKFLYESSIGRFTAWLATEPTEEDYFANDVNQEYAKWLHHTPWYEFDYFSKARGIWTDTPLYSNNNIRKWERKIFLSLEYNFKGVYAKIIGWASQSTYGAEVLNTDLIITTTDYDLATIEELELKENKDGYLLISLPRYSAIEKPLKDLADTKIEIVQIAGNDVIMITVITDDVDNIDVLRNTRVISKMNLILDPNLQRVSIVMSVSDLLTNLKIIENSSSISLEHIYDY
jgi:hypothetical protein